MRAFNKRSNILGRSEGIDSLSEGREACDHQMLTWQDLWLPGWAQTMLT